MKTKSFTLRMPVDLLEVIEQKAEPGKRSEFINQILRQALGVEGEGIDPHVSKQLSDLLYRFEVMQTQVNDIADRVGGLEGISQPLTDKAELDSPEVEPHTTEENETLLIAVPKDLPEGAQEVEGGEMLKILQTEDPTGNWSTQKLRDRRRGKAAQRRHTVGKYEFFYKGLIPGKFKNQNVHKWIVCSAPTPSSSS